MLRRSFLILPFASRLAASSDPAEVLAAMAAALSEDNLPGFLRHLDREAPAYREIEAKLEALMAQAEIASSIRILNEEAGSEDERVLQTDWYLELKSKSSAGAFERRRQIVTLRFRGVRKGWNVVDLSPVEFFAPVVRTRPTEAH